MSRPTLHPGGDLESCQTIGRIDERGRAIGAFARVAPERQPDGAVDEHDSVMLVRRMI